MLKQLHILMFGAVLVILLMNKKRVFESRNNFYVFIACVAAVLARIYIDNQNIENFEEDSDVPRAESTADKLSLIHI